MYIDFLLFVCPSQADKLLQGLENEVRESIRKDYGNSESVTSLWNATMTDVAYCIFHLLFKQSTPLSTLQHQGY